MRCVKCEVIQSIDDLDGIYKPEDWKNTMPWLKKPFFLCAVCSKKIVLDWIYEHVMCDGEPY